MAGRFDLKRMVSELRDDTIEAARSLREDFGIDPEMAMYDRLTEDDFKTMMDEISPDAVMSYIVQMEAKRLRR